MWWPITFISEEIIARERKEEKNKIFIETSLKKEYYW